MNGEIFTFEDILKLPGNTRWNVIAFEFGRYEGMCRKVTSGAIKPEAVDGWLEAQAKRLEPYRPIPRKNVSFNLKVEGIHERAMLNHWLTLIDP